MVMTNLEKLLVVFSCVTNSASSSTSGMQSFTVKGKKNISYCPLFLTEELPSASICDKP